MAIILIALIITALVIYSISRDMREYKKREELFRKIEGCLCEHKLMKERFIVINMNLFDCGIQVRCKNSKTRWFAYSELVIFEDGRDDNGGNENYLTPIESSPAKIDFSTRMN